MSYEDIRTVDHSEISELIPWYVNGTISAIDRQKLDTHFLTCAACRDELLQDRLAVDVRGEPRPQAEVRLPRPRRGARDRERSARGGRPAALAP